MSATVTDKKYGEPPLDISAGIMATLIRRGARIALFQEFLGGSSQIYKTIVYYKNRRFVSLHERPLPFVASPNGKIIEDSSLQNPPNHYNPSL